MRTMREIFVLAEGHTTPPMTPRTSLADVANIAAFQKGTINYMRKALGAEGGNLHGGASDRPGFWFDGNDARGKPLTLNVGFRPQGNGDVLIVIGGEQADPERQWSSFSHRKEIEDVRVLKARDLTPRAVMGIFAEFGG